MISPARVRRSSIASGSCQHKLFLIAFRHTEVKHLLRLHIPARAGVWHVLGRSQIWHCLASKRPILPQIAVLRFRCNLGAIQLHELHPFTPEELTRTPQDGGVYVLFQLENPVHADAAANLRKGLRAARSRFPAATYFSVETLQVRRVPKRLRELRQELGLVRAAGFGSRR